MLRFRATIAAALTVSAAFVACDDADPRPESQTPSAAAPSETTAAPSVDPTPRRTTADNRRAAARAAERVIRTVPLPPGTRRLDGKPRGWRFTYSIVGYNDSNAYQERWWSAPALRTEVLQYYVGHHPSGLRHTPGEDPYIDGLGEGGLQGSTHFYPRKAKHWRWFSGPALVIDVATVGERTVIHGYTQTSARYARTTSTKVTGDVTSIVVRRVHEGWHNRRNVVTRTFARPADDRAIDRLVRTFNHLAGSTVAGSFAMCPIIENLSYVVWFHTDAGTLSVRSGNVYCDFPLQLARDRATLRTTLSDYLRARGDGTDRNWTDVLARVLKRR